MNKLKVALVNSFVGTVALGWIFANAIERFADALAAPLMVRTTQRLLSSGMRTAANSHYSLKDGAPDLIEAIVLVLIGLVLLRWLYFKPIENSESANAPAPD